MIVTIQKRN